MPIEGQPLTIEPRYPRAAELELIGQKPTSADEALPHGLKMRNAWWSRRRGCEVFVWSEPDGSVKWGLVPAFHAMSHALKTLGASDAWGLEQESKALNLLATLVRHRQFKQYLLTGSFLETSQRSGVTYMFRKLRPTVAMAARASQTTSYEVGETEARHDAGGSSRILAALCMHSIGYYQDSWAGAMCPTDDVIAHLVLMRGDEPMFWRRCNQHPPYKPQAGL